MNVTEIIVAQIQQLLKEQGGEILIKRNDLASKLGCVPSQINYVITSRFTQQQGYIVESRRGGGGFIKIIKVNHSSSNIILHIINSIGECLDECSARIILQNLCCDNVLTPQQSKLILSAISENNFKGLSDKTRLKIRSNIFKSMLINSI